MCQFGVVITNLVSKSRAKRDCVRRFCEERVNSRMLAEHEELDSECRHFLFLIVREWTVYFSEVASIRADGTQ
jgi:hypothetical protein